MLVALRHPCLITLTLRLENNRERLKRAVSYYSRYKLIVKVGALFNHIKKYSFFLHINIKISFSFKNCKSKCVCLNVQ